MRTQEEIVARYKAAREDDMLGFRGEVLLSYLDKDHVREFLKPDTVAEWEIEPNDRESILAAARKYMEFAWGKVQDHRGISAGRSVQKLTEWCWLLGDDELVESIEKDRIPYPQYGAPILHDICYRLGFPIPDDAPTQRMMVGVPCRDGCDEGCA